MHHLENRTREPSVLASLRALVPRRSLNAWEALLIAELQANRLLEHFRIATDAVPEEIVSELPRIRVVYEADLPISGAAHWNGRYWIISLDANEPHVRQRFSRMHELKHVLDHTTKHWLYHDRPYQTADQQAELVADHFAACLLMPKRVVKRLWYSGPQDVFELARRLQVSPAALRYRLDRLGVTDRAGRCASVRAPRAGQPLRLQPILASRGSQ